MTSDNMTSDKSTFDKMTLTDVPNLNVASANSNDNTNEMTLSDKTNDTT